MLHYSKINPDISPAFGLKQAIQVNNLYNTSKFLSKNIIAGDFVKIP